MLNKGETTHALRRRIAFANRHQLRHDADPDRHVACLTLILNATVTWNTRYIQAALDHLRTTRPELVTDDAFARLAPVWHAYINPYGRCFFDLTARPALGHLRPLNTIAASVDSDVPATPISQTAITINRCQAQGGCRYHCLSSHVGRPIVARLQRASPASQEMCIGDRAALILAT